MELEKNDCQIFDIFVKLRNSGTDQSNAQSHHSTWPNWDKKKMEKQYEEEEEDTSDA